MMSKASEDFPEPLKPVMTTKRSRGYVEADIFKIVLFGANDRNGVLFR